MFAGCKEQENEIESGYHIEYLNKEKNGIVKIAYEPTATDTEGLIAEFMVMLSSDPEDVSARKTIPTNVEILDYSLDGALLTIWFDQDYSSMDNVEEVLCRAAIVRTMTQLDGISCVTFYVNDEPLKDAQGKVLGIIYPENFVENPGEQINAISETTLTLYFSNMDGDKLIKETRRVHYSSNISIEKLVMEQLLSGPETAGMRSAIPSGTKLVSASVVDGICYINLNSSFKNQDYSVKEHIVIYSIVNSLVEQSSINQVQISVDGDTSGAYRDNLLLSDMYERNLDYVTTLEEETESTETEKVENTDSTERLDTTEGLEDSEEKEGAKR